MVGEGEASARVVIAVRAATAGIAITTRAETLKPLIARSPPKLKTPETSTPPPASRPLGSPRRPAREAASPRGGEARHGIAWKRVRFKAIWAPVRRSLVPGFAASRGAGSTRDRHTVAEPTRLISGRAPRRIAVISMHTSPTASLGQNANGGLNVYVREVCSAFSDQGIATDGFA